ncbi:MAG: hypothetical protein QOI84_510 [Solirubrobacterales bacterium]|jgi:hypothetical protein|nr:hypothetical protein [Solirubrobacterales bacterium]
MEVGGPAVPKAGVVVPDGTKAHTGVKIAALAVLLGGLAYCVLLAGLAEWSHAEPFQVDLANFALFAAFIVVAGAIERFLEPLAAVLPPWGDTPSEKADRALLLTSIALIIGIIVSSVFGLYFLEAVGVKIGTQTGSGETAGLVISSNGDKLLRGLDIFVTALIITGGTKPLHDLISSIEKKKDAPAAGGA